MTKDDQVARGQYIVNSGGKRVLPLESLVPDPVIAQAAPPGGAPAGDGGQ
jgi:hypothetical protein